MEVEIKLFANFRNGRWKCKRLTFNDGINIRGILSSLEINENELGMVLVNGVYSNIETILKNNDVLSIFPPVAGG